MAHRHHEPVEVCAAAGGAPGVPPAGARVGVATEAGPRWFTWRGRRYTVCAVLDSWQERRAWWREVGDRPGEPVADTERRVWRVEACPPTGTAGVFDLGRDDDHWLLLRVHD